MAIAGAFAATIAARDCRDYRLAIWRRGAGGVLDRPGCRTDRGPHHLHRYLAGAALSHRRRDWGGGAGFWRQNVGRGAARQSARPDTSPIDPDPQRATAF